MDDVQMVRGSKIMAASLSCSLSNETELVLYDGKGFNGLVRSRGFKVRRVSHDWFDQGADIFAIPNA